MKAIISLLLITILIFSVGCSRNPPSEESSQDESISSSPSSEAEETSEVSSNNSAVSEVSELRIEEKYPFLLSPYSVSVKTRVHDVTYRYTYYFIKGRVLGAVQQVVHPNEADSIEYYNIIAKNYPDAERQGTIVTVYLEDSGLNYSGYSLKKLKFVLEHVGYEYKLNFDEEEFNKRYSSIED